ncbi:hypothetical protein AAON49_07440 [Pseudotenacibaculum sp. MALMAid0570]|uniref:hypothetical protein n=1 Tax=Pseudotenacibaculum sp. MALMAid0570 TaxID=3143938 RepID=UPI0032E0315C
MELASIEKLVVKYENAETTLKEEAILKDYFQSNDVAPHLQEYQMMFAYFQTSKDETYNKTLEFNTKKKRNYKWLSVAASFALLFSVFIGYGKITDSKKDLPSLSELSVEQRFHYEQAEKALKMLSGTLNKGSQAFDNLYAYENSVNKIFKTK